MARKDGMIKRFANKVGYFERLERLHTGREIAAYNQSIENEDFDRAMQWAAKGKYALALGHLSALIRQSPGDSFFLKHYADMLEDVAYREPKAFERATKGMSFMQGDVAVRPIAPDDLVNNAIRARYKICELQSHDVRSWSQLIDSLMHAGRYEEAYEPSVRARAVAADDRGVVMQQAYVLKALGRHGEALEVVAPLLVREPDYVEGHGLRASLLLAQGHPAEALREAEHIHALRPNERNHYSIAAQALEAMGMVEMAYDRLVECPSPDRLNYGQRARMLIKMKRYRDALEVLDEDYHPLPDSYNGPFMRAQALLGLERAREALGILDILQAQLPNEVAVYALQAQALIASSNMHGLQKQLTQQWPEHEREGNALWHLYMGRAALSKDDVAGALEQAHALYALPYHKTQMQFCRFVAALAGDEEQQRYKQALHALEENTGKRYRDLAPLDHHDVIRHEAKWQVIRGDDDAIADIARSKIFSTSQIPAAIDSEARWVSGIGVRPRRGVYHAGHGDTPGR